MTSGSPTLWPTPARAISRRGPHSSSCTPRGSGRYAAGTGCDADAEDVCQAVWLRLVAQLGNLRDPAALPGWITTTTERECSRVRRANGTCSASGQVPDPQNTPDQRTEAT